jgi:choline dehydrogenase
MSPEEFTKTSYDYVVIGGGTAGLVVAARLSENPDITVAVLEAGGNKLDDPLVDGPNLFLQLWDKPEYDWSFKTVPQVRVHHHSSHAYAHHSSRKEPRAVYMVGYVERFWEAHLLSTITCFRWLRGRFWRHPNFPCTGSELTFRRQDIDNWEELGNKGWNFDGVAPYYRKSEKYNPSSKVLSSKINDKYIDPLMRGTDGPIQVCILVCLVE